MKRINPYSFLALAVLAGIGYSIHANADWLAVHWSALLFGVYAATGVGLVIALAVVPSRPGRLRDRIFLAMVHAGTLKLRMGPRILSLVTNVLVQAMYILAWPMTALKALRNIGSPADDKHTETSKTLLAAEPFTLVPRGMLAALGLTTLALLVKPAPIPAALMFCWCAIAYVGLLCAWLALSPSGLGAYLRSASGSPYGKAVGLALVTTATLCIAYANIEARGFPSTTHLAGAARGLYAQWDSIQRLLAGEPVSSMKLLQGASGVLVFSAIAGSLLSFREFVRTDDDLVAMAQHQLHLGHTAKALATIDNVNAHNAASLCCRALALAAANQIDRAIEVWCQAWALTSSEALPLDRRLRQLIFHIVDFPVRADVLLLLFRRLIALEPAEESLVLTARVMVVSERVSPSEAAAALAQEGGERVYPLALADLLALPPHDAQRMKKASELAEQVPQTDTPLDLLRAEILLRATVVGQQRSPELRQAFEVWCARELPFFNGMATNSDLDQLLLMLAAMERVIRFATFFSSPRLEEAKSLRASIASRVRSSAPDKEIAEAFLAEQAP